MVTMQSGPKKMVSLVIVMISRINLPKRFVHSLVLTLENSSLEEHEKRDLRSLIQFVNEKKVIILLSVRTLEILRKIAVESSIRSIGGLASDIEQLLPLPPTRPDFNVISEEQNESRYRTFKDNIRPDLEINHKNAQVEGIPLKSLDEFDILKKLNEKSKPILYQEFCKSSEFNSYFRNIFILSNRISIDDAEFCIIKDKKFLKWNQCEYFDFKWYYDSLMALIDSINKNSLVEKVSLYLFSGNKRKSLNSKRDFSHLEKIFADLNQSEYSNKIHFVFGYECKKFNERSLVSDCWVAQHHGWNFRRPFKHERNERGFSEFMYESLGVKSFSEFFGNHDKDSPSKWLKFSNIYFNKELLHKCEMSDVKNISTTDMGYLIRKHCRNLISEQK